MYHSKKIGIFISHIFGSFQSNLCQGMMDKAAEFGYITEIFSSTDGEDVGNYSIGETSILRIPNYDEFSGICFASDTYPLLSLRDEISETLQEKCTCPIIEITQTDTFFPRLQLDNDRAAEQLTEHMITTHHCRRICYLGCTVERIFSEKRYRYYCDVMKKHHLPVEENYYASCDYTYESIQCAIDRFLTADEAPEAIICYNDRIALILIELLNDRNFRVPDDIAVVGFDNLEIGRNITPGLSTVTFPIYEMGQKAIELLLNSMKGISLPKITTVIANPIYRGSCGCARNRETPPSLYQNHLTERIYVLEHSMLNDIKMSSALSGIRELEDGMELLEKFLPRIDNCHEIYICLYHNWDSVSSHIREITSAQNTEEDMDLLIMPFAYKDGKRMHSCSFAKKSILPDYVYDDSHSSYIYSPLYYEDREFGYVALSYKDNQLSYQFHFLTWIVNVSRMLKDICEAKQTDLMVNRLEDIYMKDHLTGFYNRQGFLAMAEPLMKKAGQERERLLTMVFGLEGFEMIRDRFGYPEGDFAIQVLGHALEHAAKENMIIARLDNDRFYALAPGRDGESAKEIVHGIHQYLGNYNRLHTKKYPIRACIGSAMIDGADHVDLQQMFDHAVQNSRESS